MSSASSAVNSSDPENPVHPVQTSPSFFSSALSALKSEISNHTSEILISDFLPPQNHHPPGRQPRPPHQHPAPPARPRRHRGFHPGVPLRIPRSRQRPPPLRPHRHLRITRGTRNQHPPTPCHLHRRTLPRHRLRPQTRPHRRLDPRKIPPNSSLISHDSSPLSQNSGHRTQNLYLTREVLVLPNCPTPDQLEHLTPRIHRARRVCLDYTGAGIGLGDLLVQAHGEFQRGPTLGSAPTRSGKIELCTFTAPLKHELFSHLRSAFERHIIAIPGSTAIREDLHSIQRSVTANGQIHYRAAHTADGHSDRATALALALRAAESTPEYAPPVSVGRRNPFLADRRMARYSR